ncbi:MAG: recombinase RecA [Candidatus Magasanikbacteria bacterium]|jgi:recombination protein RecA|nr:recombinase RecA [Candidatus Magasanikbacteria bacterium]MBT4315213.1 recombinase RecA [Candidatus Magasanikbacteria bacterium]MBT4547253.1 recombinase RecA [Candidatus Magasanikbacteria bacterium]MBT6819020.1 recombinase RecA [Candidatus Magasanikbacteria bacterium]
MAKNKEESKIKLEVAQTAIDQIRQKYGENAIMKFGEARAMQVPAVSTGSITLDIALGVGGVPRGRIIEIFGPEASGKTTLAQHIISEVQKEGGIAAFIDAEHALDPDYAKKIGVDVDNLLISQPDTGEQALEILETLVRSNAVDVVVVDSVAALVPQKEIDGDMGDSHMGLQARLMSQALRKLTGVVSKSNTIVIFINQIRHKIGVFFGSPETTSGGNALKFYCSVRIEVRRRAQIKQGDKIIGNRVKAKVVKNKVAAPFKTTEFDIMYNEGISLSGDLLDAGIEHKIINKSGNSYSYGEEKFGVGREKAKMYLRENTKLMKEIKAKIWEAVKQGDAPDEEEGKPGEKESVEK